MEKKILHIVLLVFASLIILPLASSTYKVNNAFTQGDEINVFTSNCTYQNSSNLSQYIDCDDTVECRMTALFPNKTLIGAYKKCSRMGNQFNYSFGYYNATGTYNARVHCYGEKGWIPKDFTFIMSVATTPSTGNGGGGGFGRARPDEPEEEIPIVEVKKEPTTQEKLDETIADAREMVKHIGGYVNEKYAFLIGLVILIGGALLLWFFWVKYKEFWKEKIEKPEIPEKKRVPYY